MSMAVITPGTITREETVGNIIESIALEETSISHILNAESEKLLAIINLPNVTAAQLIGANQSVKNTVDAVIRMETALQTKLNLYCCRRTLRTNCILR